MLNAFTPPNAHEYAARLSSLPTGKPYAAEILANQGFRVKSFTQRWIPRECPEHSKRQQRFVEAPDPESVMILNETVLSLLNAKPVELAEGFVDGFIVWECDSPPRGDRPNHTRAILSKAM